MNLSQVVAGDLVAWQRFWTSAEPVIWRVTGNRRVFGRLSDQADERRDVVVLVMDRLRENDHARLRTFLAEARERADEAIRPWLVVVTTRVAIDRLRAHDLYCDRRKDDGKSRWIEIAELAGDEEQALPISPEDLATARKAFEFAKEKLGEDQVTALGAWLEGNDAEEIALRLGLADAPSATRLVRSALKRLRDRYADSGTKGMSQ